MQEDIKTLLSFDLTPQASNLMSVDLLKSIDEIIINFQGMLGDEVVGVYKKFVSMKQEAPDFMKQNLFNALSNFVEEKIQNKCYIEALFLLRFIMVKLEMNALHYYNTAEVLFEISADDLAKRFINFYEQKETNLPLKYITLGNFYKTRLNDYKSAIKYYEKYLTIDTTKAVIYTILSDLYAKTYGNEMLDVQIGYLLKAHSIQPSRLTIHALAFAYEKLGDKENAKKYYMQFLDFEPTTIDLYNLGAFLISCGDFKNGHDYFVNRFLMNDDNFAYPISDYEDKKWNFKDNISDKTLLVHYEQGFGDTFMYSRFVPLLKKVAAKIIFIVQDELFDLIKSSKKISDGIEVMPSSADLNLLKFDYHMALLDVPKVLSLDVNNLPFSSGYLEVSQDDIEKFASENISKFKKLKIGVCTHGDIKANYNGRDISHESLKFLYQNENYEVYSLHKERVAIDGLIDLSSSLKDFTSTACAIKNMDVIVSTDNVILNLAGALGVKTFGLYNKITNYRWYNLEGSNTGWYESVIPLQNKIQDNWTEVMSVLNSELEKELKRIYEQV